MTFCLTQDRGRKKVISSKFCKQCVPCKIVIEKCCVFVFLSRENTRMLGTVRNKPGPPVLPNISKGSPSPTSVTQGRQSPESPPPGRRSSQGEELRRSGEDGRNMLSQWSNAKRGMGLILSLLRRFEA